MDFSFTPEQEKLKKEVLEFMLERLPSDFNGDEAIRGKKLRDWSLKLQKEIGEKGWISIGWPKEYGGGGRGHIDIGCVSEAKGRFMGLLPNYVAYHMAVPAMLLFGTEEQKKKYIPMVAKGQDVEWMQVFTEPDAGTDESNIQLKVVEDGDSYVLNGSKIFVGDAWKPAYLYTEARTADVEPRHRGLSLFVIPADTPGLSYRSTATMSGFVKGEIFFDDVRIPKDCLIGQKNRGFYHAMTTFEFERTGTSGYGRKKQELEEFVDFCKEENRNGKPLWDEPDVRDKLAQIAVDVEVFGFFCWSTQWRFANRERLGSVGYDVSSYFRRFIDAPHCKVLSDILGLYGQILPASPKWAKLDGSIARRWESTRSGHAAGSYEAQKIVLAGRGLGLPRIPGSLNKTIGEAIKGKAETAVPQTGRMG